jgi:hypothetical protein
MTVKQKVGCAAMLAPATTRLALLATVAVFLALSAGGAVGAISAAAEAAPGLADAPLGLAEASPDLTEPLPSPTQPRLAYVTQTANAFAPKVWIASGNGGEAKLLGLGELPLIAPDGQQVAVSLLGTVEGVQETGPALGLYPASGAPIVDYLHLEEGFATPLAWSADSRYLAVDVQSTGVTDTAAHSSLDVIDTQTGTVAKISNGVIYGASFAPANGPGDRLVFAMSSSLSPLASTNLYTSEPEGAGLHRLTSDGHSLDPVWGARYIAYDHERMRRLSPEYQIWLDTPSGALARKLTHIPVGPLVQGLVPLAFSGEGEKLLAELEGEDTSDAYAVNVATGRVHQVEGARGESVMGAGISSDGRTLLIDEGSFEQPSARARISTIPFAGGHPKVLVKHASMASWDG